MQHQVIARSAQLRDALASLDRHEKEARRLRAEFAHDAFTRAIVAIDLAMRRLACAILARLPGQVMVVSKGEAPCR